jgi:hypothetical protein
MTPAEVKAFAEYTKALVDGAPDDNATGAAWVDWRLTEITDHDAEILWQTALEADRHYCGGKGQDMLTRQGYLYGQACVAVMFMRQIESHALGMLLRCAPGGAA